MKHALISIMDSCLNIPYIWGGNHPLEGLDCSGFVLWCLRSLGLWKSEDVTAQQLYTYFKVAGKELKTTEKPTLGCLIFFGKSTTAITHVAIAYSKTLMYEAGGGGSKCLNPADAKKAGAMVRIRNITVRRDIVSVISLDHLFS